MKNTQTTPVEESLTGSMAGNGTQQLEDAASVQLVGLFAGFILADDASITIESSLSDSTDSRATGVTGTYSKDMGISLRDPVVTTVGIVQAVLG